MSTLLLFDTSDLRPDSDGSVHPPEPHADKSESIPLQIERCTETAKALGAEIVETLVEPPSTSGFKDRGAVDRGSSICSSWCARGGHGR